MEKNNVNRNKAIEYFTNVWLYTISTSIKNEKPPFLKVKVNMSLERLVFESELNIKKQPSLPQQVVFPHQ